MKITMIKKYKITWAASILLAATLMVSCDELLELEPVTEISAETAYDSEDRIVSALNSAYDPLQWQFSQGAHTFGQLFQSIRADDHHSQQATFWAPGLNFDQFTSITSTNTNIQGLWSKLYKGVGRSNYAMELATDFEGFETNGLQQKIIAEAKFLRGLYYFELVKLYGDVPMFLEAITSTEDELYIPRTPASEVYAQIEKDLLEASSVLPKKGEDSDIWRATSGAALALLAKVHLYQGEYTETVKYCEMVMGQGYALEEVYSDNFSLNNEFGKESIFEINFVDGLVGGGFENSEQQEGSGSWQFMFMWVSGKFTSWGNMIPRQSLVNIFDDSDQRKEATFILPGYDLNSPLLADAGWSPAPDNFGFAVGSNAMNKKFFLTWEEINPLLSVQQSPLNEKVLRYSDVLLMHAEASLMGGGGAGQDSFQLVIDRAYGPGNSAAPAYELDGVKSERRRELATEGWNRFTDLVRWGDIEAAMDVVGKNDFNISRDALLPIPDSEIRLSNGVLEQNPGY